MEGRGLKVIAIFRNLSREYPISFVEIVCELALRSALGIRVGG